MRMVLRPGRPRKIRNLLVLAALSAGAVGAWLGLVPGRFHAGLWLLRVAFIILATTLVYSVFHMARR
jgi:hypothetical protein